MDFVLLSTNEINHIFLFELQVYITILKICENAEIVGNQIIAIY